MILHAVSVRDALRAVKPSQLGWSSFFDTIRRIVQSLQSEIRQDIFVAVLIGPRFVTMLRRTVLPCLAACS